MNSMRPPKNPGDSLPFWRTKPLTQMTPEEWESLCDGCGKCCVTTLEDEVTGELFRTNVACVMFDDQTCACKDYPNRQTHVPLCLKLTPENVSELSFFPRSCAYRLVALGRDLPDWHHLQCGDREEIHRRGLSIRGETLNEADVDPDLIEHFIVEWPGEDDF